VFKWEEGVQVFCANGGPDKILDVAWAHSQPTFCTVGIKHIFFWTSDGNTYKKNKGVFGKAGPMTNITTV
jgi:hypothetical protein